MGDDSSGRSARVAERVGDVVDAVHPADKVKLGAMAVFGAGTTVVTGGVLGGLTTGYVLGHAVTLLSGVADRHGESREGSIRSRISQFDAVDPRGGSKSTLATAGRGAHVAGLAVVALSSFGNPGSLVVTGAVGTMMAGDAVRGAADARHRYRTEAGTVDREMPPLGADDIDGREWDEGEETGRDAGRDAESDDREPSGEGTSGRSADDAHDDRSATRVDGLVEWIGRGSDDGDAVETTEGEVTGGESADDERDTDAVDRETR